jgi:hypothetical protein
MPGGNISTSQNALFTISDGVNTFILGTPSKFQFVLCTVNLETGEITVSQRTWAAGATGPTHDLMTTEEDAIGSQLFTCDNRVTYHDTTVLYYGGTYNWLSDNSLGLWWNNSNRSVATIGNQTQTGWDVWGSIDADGYVWFADWGHDDGGLFGVGNDDRLGTRKTNIRLIPDN